MIPGLTSKASESKVASATSIEAKTDIVLVTGSTEVDTIIPHFNNTFSGFLVLIPVDGTVVLGTTGNILVGISALINRAVFLMFVRSLNKWVINSGV